MHATWRGSRETDPRSSYPHSLPFARGLVSRVVPTDQTVDECIRVAEKIAKFSTPVIIAAKDCVNQSQELSLQQGLLYEKASFWGTFIVLYRLVAKPGG